MKSKQTLYTNSALYPFIRYLLVIVLLAIATIAKSQSESLTVISNQKGAPPEMKLIELKSILKGEKQRWHNGNKILIALMKTNTSVGKHTCKKIYDMNEDELKKFWLALVFQGKADPPAFFNTISELKTFVSENPGAIGIVDQPPPASEAQVVLIDGKKAL